MANPPEFMDELQESIARNSAPLPQAGKEADNLERMHFSEFQAIYTKEGDNNPVPEYDDQSHGWKVASRPDLGVKRTDMPLWAALAKEHGIEIYLKRPEIPSEDPINSVDGPAVRPIDPFVPLVSQPGDQVFAPSMAPQQVVGHPTKIEPPDGTEPEQLTDTPEASKQAKGTERRMLHDILDEPPETVRKRYMYADGHYYFRDRKNDEAFVDKGPGLSTRTNDPIVAASMLDVAQAKGWQSIRVTGSPDFMKEIWFQAQLRGMDILGYSPEPLDLARLEDAKARGLGPKPDLNNQIEAVGENRPAPAKIAKNPMAGVVVDFGEAPFNFDKREGVNQSYFISLKNEDGGLTTHWGKDLARLAKQYELKKGDSILLARLDKKDVEVQEPLHDENGKLVGTRSKSSQLNEWALSKQPSQSIEPKASAVAPVKVAAAREQLDAALDKGIHPEIFGAVQAYRIEQQHLERQNLTEPQREYMLNVAKDQLAERLAEGKDFGLPGEKPLSSEQIQQISAFSTVVREKFIADGGDDKTSVDVYWDTMSASSKLIRNGVQLPDIKVNEPQRGFVEPKIPAPEISKPSISM